MKKLLLLTAVSALGFTAFADAPAAPTTFSNSCAYALSPDGKYIVSEGYLGMKIIDAATGQVDEYGQENGMYSPGIGKCVSNNGIVVGSSENDEAVYWKDGEWFLLEVPAEAEFSNHAQAITPDGSRICGTMGAADISYDDDVLMQVPIVWNWNQEKGDYDLPVLLPHPDLDFTGRVPQYVTAVDIAEDGKTVIGQVMSATGMYRYPIIYSENEAGEWSYVIPDEAGLYPEGFTFPEYPGDAPMFPSYESYMTQEEIDAYNQALQDYYTIGDWNLPYPQYSDFMSPESLEAYEKAYQEYEEAYYPWEQKFTAWWEAHAAILANNPIYEFNSIRISPDGKKYANTVQVTDDSDPMAWYPRTLNHIWVFDIESGDIVKYDQQDDFTLTCLADGGVALAVASKIEAPKSYVLKGGQCTDMAEWIGSVVPEYKSWVEENLTFEIAQEVWNPEIEDFEYVYHEDLLTGRAYATPDLSFVVLGIENVWDYMDDGLSVLFDLSEGVGVAGIGQTEGETVIYDLNGRRLRNADAPGIYIINGEKKVVR